MFFSLHYKIFIKYWHFMKIALCQINPIIGDIEGNKKKIREGYLQGVQDKVDLVIFPELAICGYPPLDLVEKQEFRNKIDEAAKELAEITNDVGLVFGSIVEESEDVGTGVYNSALLCHNGKVRFIQHKTLLPNYDVFDEVRYFEASRENKLYDYKGEKIALSICEDIWNDDDYWKHRRYHVDPVQCQIDKGATLLVNISASPYAYGRRKERRDMLLVLTKTNSIPLAYVCSTGAQTELIFDGASMCFNAEGKLALVGRTYAEDYLIFDTEKDYNEVTDYEGSFEEEVLKALIYGLKDYAVKTGFRNALVGLSGGIDSAVVTYIAVQAFGPNNVRVVLMPSEYSSEGSITDSKKLAESLGIKSDVISIQPVFNKVKEVMAPLFEGTEEDVTEENMQSRIRGLYLMAISNKYNCMLCTTGNKSEMAVGYATLYGDMNGALGIIADVYKTGVYKIAKYINRYNEIIPIDIIEKAPSAELRPGQKDEDSLPPYETLDRILVMYLEEYKEINEIVEKMGDRETVERVLKLVDKNEFKRRQAAPALRVTTKAFGYGRRFPVVQRWER